MVERRIRESERVYERHLPGGGFVAIEAAPVHEPDGPNGYRGEVIVERRADRSRRDGHRPPTVARTVAASIASLFHELYPLAQSNTAIAEQCLHNDRRRRLTLAT